MGLGVGHSAPTNARASHRPGRGDTMRLQYTDNDVTILMDKCPACLGAGDPRPNNPQQHDKDMYYDRWP